MGVGHGGAVHVWRMGDEKCPLVDIGRASDGQHQRWTLCRQGRYECGPPPQRGEHGISTAHCSRAWYGTLILDVSIELAWMDGV